MSEHTIQAVTEKHTGPDTINPAAFEHYGIEKKDVQEIYNNYRLYNRIMQYNRKLSEDKDEVKRKSKLKYYCELCDKDVRIAVKYHHVRTMKHLKFQDEVEKKMRELELKENKLKED